MKVIIYEPEPRMCGPMTWAFNLQEGMRRLGHECHILCSSKSGKERVSWGTPQSSGGARWWSRRPDIVVKHDALVETLDTADMIVMPEVLNPVQDNEALKSGDLPPYVDALRRTRTPWTTALHGGAYPDSKMPFFEALMESPSLGTLMTVSQYSLETNERFASMDIAWIRMPYALRSPIDAPATLRPVVGMLGRFMPNKGGHVAMYAACDWLSDRYVYEQWGAASKGASASPTYEVWKYLQEFYPDHQTQRYHRDNEVHPGNKINPYHWDFRPSGRAIIRYMGNYTDPVATAARLGVHLALTSVKFAGGLVEYSTLEAADAGCLCVTPRHFSDPQFRMMVLPNYADTLGTKRTFTTRRDSDVAEVGWAMQTCLEMIEANPAEVQQIVEHNRSVITTRNDPAAAATEAINAAFTKGRR